MARIYAPPAGFEPPEFDPSLTFEEEDQREREYLGRLATAIRGATSSKDPAIGKEVSWCHGDGHARYMVNSVRPLSLIHLALGDGWRLPAAHERGLSLADVRHQIKGERAWMSVVDQP